MKMMPGPLDLPHGRGAAHYVQFYADDIAPLARNVGLYVAEGISRGEPALVIAASEHTAAFVRQVEQNGCDVPEAIRTGRLVLLDAAETLAELLPEGRPDWSRTEKIIGARIQSLRRQTGAAGIRVYGEMVGLLWNDGRTADALRLEERWSRQQALCGLTLYCAYQIDVFGHEFQEGLVGQILAAHSSMISGLGDEFGPAIDGAALEMTGQRAGKLEAETAMPAAESAILWLRGRHPACADEILARARARVASAGATSRPVPNPATSRYLPG